MIHSLFHALENDAELIPDVFPNNLKYRMMLFSAFIKSNASIQYNLCSLPFQKTQSE